MPDIPSKFQKDPSITFRVILLTHRQTNRKTNKVRQKHNLLGGGNEKRRYGNRRNETTPPLDGHIRIVSISSSFDTDVSTGL